MKRLFCFALIITFLVAIALSGCTSSTKKETEKETEKQGGTLQFKANGEDFVRQGFVSKDGWEITFDHVYVTLEDITAYQSDPPYDAEEGGEIQAKTDVSLSKTYTVDLAEGDEDASPILVDEVDALVGQYNAISWNMVKAPEGEAKGYSLVIVGKAVKEGKTVNFTIKDEEEYEYKGGEYVGDERKGIVEKDSTADLEMTFHFDHIFGDAETDADDELNVGAPGFEPFAALAEGSTLDVDLDTLKARLSPEDYQKLEEMLPTLGHVGEGHCHCEIR